MTKAERDDLVAEISTLVLSQVMAELEKRPAAKSTGISEDLAQRIKDLEADANRHKGGPVPRVFTAEEIAELEQAVKLAKRNATPAKG